LLYSAKEKLKIRVNDFNAKTLSTYKGKGHHLTSYFDLTEEAYKYKYKDKNLIFDVTIENSLSSMGIEWPYKAIIAPKFESPLNENLKYLSFSIELNLFFSQLVNDSFFTLEYGSGSSTSYLIKNSKKCMSVESDSDFLLNLLQEIATSGFVITSTPVYVNIGKTKEWGHPVDDSCKASWHEYSLKPWRILASNDISPDLVLIDGRFRVACMLATMASIKKPTKVIFVDYVDRPYKKIIEKYCRPLKIIDRAAYFELTPGMLSAADLLDCFDQFFDPA
jgi:hypothetical protein